MQQDVLMEVLHLYSNPFPYFSFSQSIFTSLFFPRLPLCTFFFLLHLSIACPSFSSLLLLSNLLSIRLPSRLSAQTLWDLCCSLCFLIPAHLAAQPSACCQGYQTGREVGFLSVCVCVCLCVPVKKRKKGG